MGKFINFFKEEEGATAVEYGILVALISVAIIVIVAALGGKLNDIFTLVNTKLDTAYTEGGGS